LSWNDIPYYTILNIFYMLINSFWELGDRYFTA
jgi:hypothetical protein